MDVVFYAEGVAPFTLPPWVVDFASFCRWTDRDDFPEEGRIGYFGGRLQADMSKEQVFSHTAVKGEVTRALLNYLKAAKTGRFFPDGLRVIHDPSELSNVPDGTYVSFDSLRAGRARYVPNADGFSELNGVPDIVIEVVSPSSEDKDAEWLQKAYWEAGIPEYWLIDARRDPLRFTIFRHAAKGYAAARPTAGWVKSKVLAASFRLSATVNGLGQPDYTLDVR
ncbi:MAG: Uma2 family endonuclease [Gemmataceae bacterium]